MILELILYTAIAFVTPKLLRGVKVEGMGAALGVALVFGLLNLLIGWLLQIVLTLVSLPLACLTFGIFSLILPTLVNAALLRLTDVLLESFRLDGWLPAFGMGFLFALGGVLTQRL